VLEPEAKQHLFTAKDANDAKEVHRTAERNSLASVAVRGVYAKHWTSWSLK
jgi:hypothetical protein